MQCMARAWGITCTYGAHTQPRRGACFHAETCTHTQECGSRLACEHRHTTAAMPTSACWLIDVSWLGDSDRSSVCAKKQPRERRGIKDARSSDLMKTNAGRRAAEERGAHRCEKQWRTACMPERLHPAKL
eukprot:364287-Chlamydomonas_euryale.AAC.8